MPATATPTPTLPKEQLARLLGPSNRPPDAAALREWLVHVLIHRPALVEHVLHLSRIAGGPDEPPVINALYLSRVTDRVSEVAPAGDGWEVFQQVVDGGPAAVAELAHPADLLLNPTVLFAVAEAIDEDHPPAWADDLRRDAERYTVESPVTATTPEPTAQLPRPRRRVAWWPMAVAAGVLVGIGGLIGWSLKPAQQVAKVVPTTPTPDPTASAAAARVPTKGGDTAPELTVSADFDGFVSVVALTPGEKPYLFPRPGQAPLRVRPNEPRKTGPFPPAAADATRAVVVVTRTPARESLQAALDGRDDGPDRAGALAEHLRGALRESNYADPVLRAVDLPPADPKAAGGPAVGPWRAAVARLAAPLLAGVSLAVQSVKAPPPADDARPKPHYYDRVVAVCVGVNSEKPFEELKYAEKDAERMADVFEKKFGYETVLLTGQKATAQAVRDKLAELKRELGENDVLIVFFSGHGVLRKADGDTPQTGFFLTAGAKVKPSTAELKEWREQCLEMKEVVGTLKGMKTQHAVLLADCCYSGQVFARKAGASGGSVLGLMTGKSQYALTATTQSQTAAEDRDLKGGFFTLALLDALRTKEAVELSEVGRKVRNGVREKRPDMLPLCQAVSDEVSDGELVFFPKVIPDEEIVAMRQAIKDPKKAGGEKAVLAGVLQRKAEAVKRRTTTAEVVAAYQAIGYEYSADPERRRKEWRAKVERYTDNADEGDANAAAALVYCYANGLGVKKDPELALNYARLAEASGEAVGLHVLGKCYFEGLGVEKNGQAGMGYIKRAAEAKKPFPVSLVSLGIDALMAGPERRAEAREWFEKALKAGVPLAACWLADDLIVKYRWNWTDAEVTRVEEMLKPAAAAGVAWAKQQLAELYARRPTPDLALAEKWLRAAADDGHPRAQYLLARELSDPAMHFDFDEVRWLALKSDPSAASDYATNAAKQRDTRGMCLVACMSVEGYGNVRASDADAQKWCNEAVKANEPKAQLLRSKWYYRGEAGLPKDGEKQAADAWDAVNKAHGFFDRDALVWLAALYADRVMPAKEPYLDPKRDKDGGKFVYEHHALRYFYLGTVTRHAGADEGFKEFTDIIRKNPDVLFWQYFQRDYPADAKELAKQEKLPLKK